jgi:uncharacterized membrane protein YraQ (UPF0718 family)
MKEPHQPLGGWIFLGSALLAWAAVALVAPPQARETFTHFDGLLARVLPALAGVFLLLFVANVVMERPWIERQLGRKPSLGSWLFALAAGVLAVGSLYAWFALVGELKQKGLRPGLAAAFLYAFSVKLPLLPLLVHFFGLTYAIVLNVWLMVFAVLVGLLVDRFEGDGCASSPDPGERM